MNELTLIQKQVLDGAMLGDGSLIIHKNGKNAYLSYLSKSKAHVEYVMNYFSDFITNAGICDSSSFDKRTNKTYFYSCAKTHALEVFTEERKRWYSDKKHIPENLILTPLTCLIWYIGDGGLINGHSQYIKLATNCFEKEEQERILLPQLSQFEAILTKADVGSNGKQQYFIKIPHKRVKDFLNYIGDCPFPDYSYKWEYKEYKNFCINKNPDFIKEIVQLFELGYSAGTIAKYEKVDRSTVVKYLTKEGLDPKKNAYSKLRIKDINLKGENI